MTDFPINWRSVFGTVPGEPCGQCGATNPPSGLCAHCWTRVERERDAIDIEFEELINDQ